VSKLEIVRVELKEANAFVDSLHRHHKPVRGHRFSIGASRNGSLCGVAIVGRPVARATDQKNVAEVTRLCTDGTPHVCSFLYAACARIAKELGFSLIQTYILESEPGISLLAAGWEFVKVTAGGDWNCHSRGNRRTDQPMVPKQKFEKRLRSAA
jgi:hypothetical protein